MTPCVEYTTSGTVTLLRVLILWVPEQHNWGRMVSKWIVWRRAVSCLHNQAPIETQLAPVMEYTDIRYSDIPTMYWFCECQSSTTGGRMVSNELCEGEQSHAYIIKHQLKHNWLLAMEYTDISTVTLLRVLILWVPELENWGTDGLQMNVWGRAVSCLHNQAPNLTQLILLMDTLTSGTVTYYVYWFCECQSSTTGGRMSPNELCEGEQSQCLHIKHPIETHWLLVMEIHWHQVQWHSYVYWFCECQSENWRTDVSKWNCVRESSLMLHNQAPNWNTIDFLRWNTLTQYSDITTCIDSVSAEHTTGGRMVSKWIVWGEQSQCLHNQAPNLTQLILVMNTLTSGTVTLLRVLILWVPEQHNGGRMVSKWIGVRRAVSCLHNQAPNWTQLAPCDGIHWHQVQWHSYMYWSVECQSSTTGDGWSPMNCVRRAVSCLHNQAPIEKQLAPCGMELQNHTCRNSTCIDSV